jgi:hypothetical protein
VELDDATLKRIYLEAYDKALAAPGKEGDRARNLHKIMPPNMNAPLQVIWEAEFNKLFDAETQRQAFERELEHAKENGYATETIDGVEWIWKPEKGS